MNRGELKNITLYITYLKPLIRPFCTFDVDVDVDVRHLIGKEQMVNTSKVVNYTHKFSKTSVTNGFKETSSTKGERNWCVDQNNW